jgi:hypothetical protein
MALESTPVEGVSGGGSSCLRHGNTGGNHLGGSGRPRSVERPRRRSGDRDRGVRGDDRREAGKRTPCLCSSGPAEAGSVGVNRRVPRRGRVRIRVLLRATRARVQIWVESFGWQKSDGRFLLPRRYALERSRTRRASSQKEAATGGKAFAVEPRRKGSCVRRLAGIIPYASRSTRRASGDELRSRRKVLWAGKRVASNRVLAERS